LSTAASSAPTATSPWTAYEVDWEFDGCPAIWPKPPSAPWMPCRKSIARFAAGLDERPTEPSACSTMPVMSASLFAARVRPNPPSSFWLPISHVTLADPADSPAARNPSTPNAV
jgi:hypothetical protein